MNGTAPIDYERDGQVVRGHAAWRVLEHFGDQADEDVLESVKERLPIALRDFPALAHETVNVGILYENADARAQAFGYNRLICLPPDEPTANITLWHELGHVAIRVRYEDGEDVAKTSEEFCSIYSVARMPPGAIDEDRIAYLGYPDAPREEWPEICRRALEYREDHHDYIQQCKDWLEI
jgi:hypothetical protein